MLKINRARLFGKKFGCPILNKKGENGPEGFYMDLGHSWYKIQNDISQNQRVQHEVCILVFSFQLNLCKILGKSEAWIGRSKSYTRKLKFRVPQIDETLYELEAK